MYRWVVTFGKGQNDILRLLFLERRTRQEDEAELRCCVLSPGRFPVIIIIALDSVSFSGVWA